MFRKKMKSFRVTNLYYSKSLMTMKTNGMKTNEMKTNEMKTNGMKTSEMKKPLINRITLSESAWIEQGMLPTDLTSKMDFETLWELHPEKLGEVRMFGRLVPTPRWQQSYMQDYFFTGVEHKAAELPVKFQPFLSWANQVLSEICPNLEFNQALINWYQDGNHYIGPHRDDERQLVKHSPIMSISLGQQRTFRVKNRFTGVITDIQMPDTSFLVMCGTMQRDFTHEVLKVTGQKGRDMGRRINVTFRVFKTKCE